uniref:Rho-GAP domain-containing protein n=1 Tax=Eptatretus burgeri TaxID=7764 RepID=A0A8C4NET2_EPTBU
MRCLVYPWSGWQGMMAAVYHLHYGIFMKQLSAHCDVEGLFRKSGSQLRIQTLREKVELVGPAGFPQLVAPHTHLEAQDPAAVDGNFEDAMSSLHDEENKSSDRSVLSALSSLLCNTTCPHSLADLLKCFLRELPLPLVPPKLFLSSARGTALQLALLLLPDVAREALQSVLALLGAVVKSPHSRMTPHSLALCLAPSLCHLHHDLPARAPKRSGAIHSQLERKLVATECVKELISHHGKIFQVPQDLIAVESSYQYEVIPNGPTADLFLKKVNDQLEQKLNALPHQIQSSGWKTVTSPPGTQLAYKTVDDGCPLRLWRASLELKLNPAGSFDSSERWSALVGSSADHRGIQTRSWGLLRNISLRHRGPSSETACRISAVQGLAQGWARLLPRRDVRAIRVQTARNQT